MAGIAEVVSTGKPDLYAIFGLLVVALLVADFVLPRTLGTHEVPSRDGAGWSVLWVAVAPSATTSQRALDLYTPSRLAAELDSPVNEVKSSTSSATG